MDMKKYSVNIWKLCFSPKMVFAITGAVVVLYGSRVNVTGNDYAQPSPVPAISVAAERKIVRYDRNNSDPVFLNLSETRLFFGLSRIENDSVKTISKADWDSFLETSVSPFSNLLRLSTQWEIIGACGKALKFLLSCI